MPAAMSSSHAKSTPSTESSTTLYVTPPAKISLQVSPGKTLNHVKSTFAKVGSQLRKRKAEGREEAITLSSDEGRQVIECELNVNVSCGCLYDKQGVRTRHIIFHLMSHLKCHLQFLRKWL